MSKNMSIDCAAEFRDIQELYNDTMNDLADCTDDPEMREMAVAAGRIRTLARVSENAMGAIGKCLGAVSSLFGKN